MNQTDEEIKLVKDHIMLNVMVMILPHEIKVLKESGFKMGHIYAAAIDNAHKDVIRKLTENRIAIRKSRVKILDLKITKGKATVWIICGGYRDEITLLGDMLKAETQIRLAEYLGLDLSKD